ncbi:hypothetical protein ACLBXM_23090 [Xanthobacteraceae bacterium A53D]
MRKFRLWLSGFFWGAVIGIVASAVGGVAFLRPDIWDKMSVERIQRALNREFQSATSPSPQPSPTVSQQAVAPPAAASRVLASNTNTKSAVELDFRPARAFLAGDTLVIKGTNASSDFLELNLRIDDSASNSWASRFGAVNVVAPGPFEWVVPFQGLQTQDKRAMDLNAISRIIFFTPENLPPANVASIAVESRTGQISPAAPAATGSAGSQSFATNTTTQQAIEQNFSPPRAFGADDTLVIRGTNPTNAPLELDLRMDDAQSKDWGSRFGAVNMLPPGPFEWVMPLKDLITGNRQPLNTGAITRIILFTPEGAPAAQISSMGVESKPGFSAPVANEVKAGQSWLKGASTTAQQEFYPPVAFAQDQELVVTGTNPNSTPITVYLRIDDVNSKNWNNRVNTTTTVPPGPFTVRSPVSSWVTPSKTRLDRTKVSRIVVSIGEGEGTVKLNDMHVAAGTTLPNNALGLRFGPPEVSVPGFETVTKDDKRLGAPARDLVRTQNDPLLSSGLNGVKTITVPWDKSQTATVTLWTEDQGEWEYFPHSLNRSFIINGSVALRESFTPDEWVEKVFHRNLHKEAMLDGDPWEVYAGSRAGLVTATVPVVDGKITVEISSDQPPNDGYIAAMVIEPGIGNPAARSVEQWRRERYNQRWPLVVKPVDPALAKGVTLRAIPEGRPHTMQPFWDPNLPTQTRLRAVRGQVVSMDFLAFSDQADPKPQVALNMPEGIKGDVRWGKWTYMRRGVGENALNITADVLEGNLSEMRIAKGIPRRINVSFTVPETASGTIPVALAMNIAGQSVQATTMVEVIPFTLPPTKTPIGYYMAAPNPDYWFPPSSSISDHLMSCDLKALRRFGLTGLSPDFVVPTDEWRARYVAQTRLASDAGFSTPFFDYVSAKLLTDRLGVQGMGENIAATTQALKAAGLPIPLWSIADEPQNLANPMQELRRQRDAIRLYSPDAKIAGQLNDIKDKPLLPLFDVVLVNNGYGVSAREFADMRAQGITPWFYNMPDIEAAAGFFLWRVGAEGYIQWHARAATADPSDPTDGREPDFLLLPLTKDRCQPVPTVDAMVQATADGITDLRFLQWLDSRAASDERAKALRDEIFAAIPGEWQAFAKAKPDFAPLRKKLLDYAASVAAQ